MLAEPMVTGYFLILLELIVVMLSSWFDEFHFVAEKSGLIGAALTAMIATNY